MDIQHNKKGLLVIGAPLEWKFNVLVQKSYCCFALQDGVDNLYDIML